jgi:hypothetical protein
MTPYVSAAVAAYGAAVLARVRDEAADATVGLGRRLLQRVFGTRSDGEALPQPLADLAANPDDTDTQAVMRLALRRELTAHPELADQLRSMLAAAPGVSQQLHVEGPAYTAGRDQVFHYHGSSPAHPAHDWPIWAGKPSGPVGYFQDRPQRKELAEAFEEGEDVVVTQALIGAGGVGKTRLAADFARNVWEEGKVDLVVWVNASSRPTIISTYADAANQIGASTSTREEQAAEHFLSWMAKRTGKKWLVVLDDVAEDDADVKYLAQLWPPQNDWGHTVITTRQHALPFRSSRQKVLEVGMFSPPDALHYLQRSLSDHPDALSGCEELTRVLGYHPLALAAAAAYIRGVVETGSKKFAPSTCAQYVSSFADQRTKLAKIMPTRQIGYERSMTAIWSISIDRVDEEHPSGIAHRLMVLLSVLDPNGVPFEILDTPEIHGYLEPWSPDEIDDALLTLRYFSLINFGGADGELVNVHMLVQRAVRETNKASFEAATLVLADSMSAHWPKKQHSTVSAGLLRANAAALYQANAARLQTPGLHGLLFQLGDGYGKAGLAEQAHQYFTDLGEQVTQVLGADSPGMLRVRERNAYWLGFSGKAAEARAEFEAISASLERTLGPEHVRTFAARHDAARFRGRSGDAQGAVERLRLLVADETSVLGDEHDQALESRSILGYWLNKAGQRGESLAHLEELLVFRSGLHGCAGLSECADGGVLTTRIDLSITKADLGDYDGAVALAETVVRDRIALDGLEDAATMSAVAYLACWRALRGDENGVAELEASVAHHLRVLGERHNNTLRVQAFLIVGLYAGRRITRAEAIARMTSHLAVIHELFGLTHVTAQYCQERLDEWQRAVAPNLSERGS